MPHDLDEKALAAAMKVGSNIADEFLVREIIAAYESAKPAPEPSAEMVEAERLRTLVGLLQDDIAKLAEDCERCEGCGAPIAYDEDSCTASDVRGCWGYTADIKGTPCWRYRTKEGMDRAWPECAALAATEALGGR